MVLGFSCPKKVAIRKTARGSELWAVYAKLYYSALCFAW
jgi:hypothetical protein